MAGTFTRKKLAFVQLSNTPSTTIYDSGAAIGLVHNLLFYNSNTTTEVVLINLHDGTNEYCLYRLSIAAYESVKLDFRGEGLVVDASSKLTGSSTTNAKVTCSVNGQEET